MYTYKSVKLELELTPNETAAMMSFLFASSLNEKGDTWEKKVLSSISQKVNLAVFCALGETTDIKGFVPKCRVSRIWSQRYVDLDIENMRWRFIGKEVA